MSSQGLYGLPRGSVFNSGDRVYNQILANTTLSSNASYIATVAGLVCRLPSSPDVGDVIRLSTGNFPFTVLHGNASQQILNINNLTSVGIVNGIYLNSRSAVDLVFEGSNIWVTQQRARTVNNWIGNSIVSAPSANTVAYTPSNYNGFGLQFSTTPSSINDGISSPGGSLPTGLLANSNAQVLITFASPTILQSINLFCGQANVSLGATPNYKVDSLSIYGGNTLSTLIASISPNATLMNCLSQLFDVTNSTAYTQYVFVFNSIVANRVGVMELVLYNAPLLFSGSESTAF